MNKFLRRYLALSTLFRVVAAGCLFFALTKQPYDYFVVLRFVICFVAAYLIYVAIITKKPAWIVLFAALIVLFNPIKTFAIKRETWAIIDVFVAVLMFGSIFFVGEKLKKPLIDRSPDV